MSYPLFTDTGTTRTSMSSQSLTATNSVVLADLSQAIGGTVEIYDSNAGLATVQLAAGGKTVRSVVATNPTTGAGEYVAGTPGTAGYGVTVANTGNGYDLTVTAGATAATVSIGCKPNLLSSNPTPTPEV